MAKYIIETDDENPVELNGQELYRVKGFPWMALSDNDLDKLESVEEGFLGHVAGYSALWLFSNTASVTEKISLLETTRF